MSKCSIAALVVADADGLIYMGKKNLTVPYFAGSRGSRNCLYNPFHHVICQYHFNLDFRNEIDRIFTAAVNLGVTLLPAMAAGLEHGHAFHTDFMKRFLHRFQL